MGYGKEQKILTLLKNRPEMLPNRKMKMAIYASLYKTLKQHFFLMTALNSSSVPSSPAQSCRQKEMCCFKCPFGCLRLLSLIGQDNPRQGAASLYKTLKQHFFLMTALNSSSVLSSPAQSCCQKDLYAGCVLFQLTLRRLELLQCTPADLNDCSA